MYVLSGFAYGSVLILEMIVLDAEFRAISNDVTFTYGHPAKHGCSTPTTHLIDISQECFLFRFANRSVLILEMIVPDADFYSLSNGVSFK